jgi:MFS family permease
MAAESHVPSRAILAGAIIALPALASAWVVLPVLRDPLQQHYGLSNAGFAFLVTFGNATGAAGALAGGVLTDRRGSRPVFLASLAGCAASLALAGIPGPWWLMLLAISLLNFFWYPLGIAAQAFLVDLYPDHRRRMLTASLAGGAVLGMAFPLLGEGILGMARATQASFAWTFHGLFGLVGALCLAGLLGCARPSRGLERPHPQEEKGAGNQAATGGLGLLVAMGILHVTSDTIHTTWMPKILAGSSFATHPMLPGVAAALFSLAYVLSRLLLGLLPERAWQRRLLVLPGLVGGFLLAAGLATRTQEGAVAGYLAGGFCWSLEYPTYLALLSRDRRFGTAMAAMNVGFGVLGFLAPTCLGLLADRFAASGAEGRTWTILLVPAGIFVLNGVLGALWVRRHGHTLGARAG